MPSKNMIRKGKRRQSVKAEYRLHRDAVRDQAATAAEPKQPLAEAPATLPEFSPLPSNPIELPVEAPGSRVESEEDGVRAFIAGPIARGLRLDAFLSRMLPEISRSRLQLLISAGQVTVQGKDLPASTHLKGGERIEVVGDPVAAPLHGEPEDIPLDILYEDDDLAVINKPAGMMVHAGSGSPEHNRGTLVNALLFHFGKKLSALGGEMRPGIVHRLDKDTSGVILVAKNDQAHQRLSEQFSSRSLQKTYLALVQGLLKEDEGTVDLPVSRDLVHRTRMTTRRSAGRHAVTHWRVLDRLDGAFGKFTLLELGIETGRTHQIRVHMQALGHPVVGDRLYGAAAALYAKSAKEEQREALRLERNFLHAAQLQFRHPVSDAMLEFVAPLPSELEAFLLRLQG